MSPRVRQTNPSLTPERLRAWRARHGWSQHAVARKLHIAQATWARWESGTRTAPWYLGLALDCLAWDDFLHSKRTLRLTRPSD